MRTGAALVGAAASATWLLLFGLLARSARAYVWLEISAGLLALLAALALAWRGDRGVAVGVAAAAGLGVAIAFLVVLLRWVHGPWLLW